MNIKTLFCPALLNCQLRNHRPWHYCRMQWQDQLVWCWRHNLQWLHQSAGRSTTRHKTSWNSPTTSCESATAWSWRRRPTEPSHNSQLSETLSLPCKLLYCGSTYSGFCSATDCKRLDLFLGHCGKLVYRHRESPSFAAMFYEADDSLFTKVLTNSHYLFQQYQSERCKLVYSLWKPTHNKHLIAKTTKLIRHFLVRPLYKDTYYYYICIVVLVRLLLFSRINDNADVSCNPHKSRTDGAALVHSFQPCPVQACPPDAC